MFKHIRLQNKNYRTRRNIGFIIGIPALMGPVGGKLCVVLHHTLTPASSLGSLLRHGPGCLAPSLDLWWPTSSLQLPLLHVESPLGQVLVRGGWSALPQKGLIQLRPEEFEDHSSLGYELWHAIQLILIVLKFSFNSTIFSIASESRGERDEQGFANSANDLWVREQERERSQASRTDTGCTVTHRGWLCSARWHVTVPFRCLLWKNIFNSSAHLKIHVCFFLVIELYGFFVYDRY